ncbi:MAG: hypothetical protein QW687_02670 [Candidatus Hadarchaeales archaeon]
MIWTFNYKAHIPKPLTETSRTTFTPLRSQSIGTELRFVTEAYGVVHSGNISVPGRFGFEFHAVFPSVTDGTQYLPLLKSTLEREDFHIPDDVVMFFPVRGVSWYSWGWFIKGIHNLSDDIKGILVGTHMVYDDEDDPLRFSGLFLNPLGNAFYEDVRSYFYTGNPNDPRVVNPVLIPRRLFDNLRLYIRFFDTVYIFRPTEYARRRYYRLVEEEFAPIMNALQGLSWLEPHPIKDDEELSELIGVPTESCSIFWSFGLGEALYTAVFPDAVGAEILPYPKFRPPTLNTEFLRSWLNEAYNIRYRPSKYAQELEVTDWEVLSGPGWASWSWFTPIYNEDDVREFDRTVRENGGDWKVTYASFSTARWTGWGIEMPAVLNVPTPILFWTSTTGNYIVLGLETEDVPGENITLVDVRDSYEFVGKVSYMRAYLVARANLGITPTKRLKETAVLYRPPRPELMNRAFSPWLELEEVFVVPFGGKVKPQFKMKPREHFKVLDYMSSPDSVTTKEGSEVTPQGVSLVWWWIPTGDSSNVSFAPEREGIPIDHFNDSISFSLPVKDLDRTYRDFVDTNLIPIITKSIERIREEMTERKYLHRRLGSSPVTGWQYGAVDGRPSPSFIIDMTTEKQQVTLKDFWMKVGNPEFKLIDYEEIPEEGSGGLGGYPVLREREVPGTEVKKVFISEISPPFLYVFPSLPIDQRRVSDSGLVRAPRFLALNSPKVTPPEIQTIHTLWIDESFPSSFVVWKPDERGKVRWMVLVDPSAWDDLPLNDIIRILGETKIWNAYRCDESEWTESGELLRYNQPVMVAIHTKSLPLESFSEGVNELRSGKFVVVRSFSSGNVARVCFINHQHPSLRLKGGFSGGEILPFLIDFVTTLNTISYRLGNIDEDVFDTREKERKGVKLIFPKDDGNSTAEFHDGFADVGDGKIKMMERGWRVSPEVVKPNVQQIPLKDFLALVREISSFYRFRSSCEVSISSAGTSVVTEREDISERWLQGKSLGLVYPPNVLGIPLTVPVVDYSFLNSSVVIMNERLLYVTTKSRDVLEGGIYLQPKRKEDDYDYWIYWYPVTDHLNVMVFYPKGIRDMGRFLTSADGKLPTIPFSNFSFVSPPFEILDCFYFSSSPYNFLKVNERLPVVELEYELGDKWTVFTHPDEYISPYFLPSLDYKVVLKLSDDAENVIYDPSLGDNSPLRLDWKGYWWEVRETEKWEPTLKQSYTPGLKLALETVDLCIGISDEDRKVIHRPNPKHPYHSRIHLLPLLPDLCSPVVVILIYDGKVCGLFTFHSPTYRFLVITPKDDLSDDYKSLLEEISNVVESMLSGENESDPFTRKMGEELMKLLSSLLPTISQRKDEFPYYLYYKPKHGVWNWKNGGRFLEKEDREPLVLGIVGTPPPFASVGIGVEVSGAKVYVGGGTPNLFYQPFVYSSFKDIPLELLPYMVTEIQPLSISLWGRDFYPSVVEISDALKNVITIEDFYREELNLPTDDGILCLGASYVGSLHEPFPLTRIRNNLVLVSFPYTEWRSDYKEVKRKVKIPSFRVRLGDTVRELKFPVQVIEYLLYPFITFNKKNVIVNGGSGMVLGGIHSSSVPNFVFSKNFEPIILFGVPYRMTNEVNFSWTDNLQMVFLGLELTSRSVLWTLHKLKGLFLLKNSNPNHLRFGLPPTFFSFHPITIFNHDILQFPVVDVARLFNLLRYIVILSGI